MKKRTKKRRELFRVAMLADLHLSNSLPHAMPSKEGGTDRLEDCCVALERFKIWVANNSISTVFILGDVFDKRLLDAVTLYAAMNILASIDADVYILPGNHDAHSIDAIRYTTEVFGVAGHDNIKTFHTGASWTFEGIVFHPIPYAPLKQTRQALKDLEGDDTRDTKLGKGVADFLLMHQAFIGAEHLGWVCDEGLDPYEIPKGVKFVFTGHFHKHQTFRGGMYLGGPWQKDFGEDGYDCGFWDVRFFSDGDHQADHVKLTAPRFHVLRFNDEELEEQLDDQWMKDVVRITGPEDFIRLEIEATHAGWHKLKDRVEDLVMELRNAGRRAIFNHRPIYHHEERLDSGDGVMDFRALIREYVKSDSVNTDGLNEDELVSFGLAILDDVWVEP